MGFVMLCTLGSFLKEKNGFIAHFSREASGATVGFVVIFSLITCMLACCGTCATSRRQYSNTNTTLNCSYGMCLFFFGFIPLVAVSGALFKLSEMSQADLIAMCYYEVHDSVMLKDIAAPMGATDVYPVEVRNKFSRQMIDLAFEFDDLSEQVID